MSEPEPWRDGDVGELEEAIERAYSRHKHKFKAPKDMTPEERRRHKRRMKALHKIHRIETELDGETW